MKAVFIQRAETADYIPQSNVKAGDIVIQNGLKGVAKLDIPANTLGTLSLCGLYRVEKGTASFAAGQNVYWNSVSGKATASASDTLIGLAAAAAASGDGSVTVWLNGADHDTVTETAPAAAIADVTAAGTDSANLIAAVNAILAALRGKKIVATA